MPEGRAEVQWRAGGVPVSARFDDPYFSLEDGLAESRHVFLAGNGLPGRFADGFAIAELGFGTGLNLLAAVACWREAGVAGRFRFTSFEAFPLAAAEMAIALAGFPDLADLAAPLLQAWDRGARRFALPDCDVEVVTGDAGATLPDWRGTADAWFLDGFAPAKNPALWAPGLLAEVARHTAPGGTLATYTAAGHVRRSLAGAGFTVTRCPGFGRKRHMTRAVLEPGV